MTVPGLKSSKVLKYALCAALLGLAASVCAEKAGLGKDIGLLTPAEIEENVQVQIKPDWNF